MTLTTFTSRIVESANLIGLFINHNCSARSIFSNSHIKSTVNLIEDLPVHIRDVGTYDILRKRICWDDTFFIKSIQENLCITFFSSFIYAKKLGMSLAFFLKCIKSLFKFICKHRIMKCYSDRQEELVLINIVGSKTVLETVKEIFEKNGCGNCIKAHMFFCKKFL